MSWYPDLLHVQAAGDGGPRTRTQVIVIHATDNTAPAANEAQYASYRPDQTSAHFYVDADQVIQGLDTSHVAYGCLWHGNQISVQLELCGLSNHLDDAVLRRAAPIVARICSEFGIPARKIGPAEVAAGVAGICGHADITLAFPADGGDHTDPGTAFPWTTFVSYVAGTGQGGDDDMSAETEAIIKYELRPWLADTDHAAARVESAVAGLVKQVDALVATVATLASRGTSVDTAVLLDAIAKVGAAESAAVADLRARLAAAAQAGADELAPPSP